MSLPHQLLALHCRSVERDFSRGLSHCEATQRATLRRILRGLKKTEKWRGLCELSYEQLIERLAISKYSDFVDDVQCQRHTQRAVLSSDISRWEPTSGSTDQRKWIPYSQAFLNEINWAASTWLADLYKSYPGIKRGRHYWSMSWLPEDLRAQMSTNDVDLFPWYQRLILQRTMAVPAQTGRLPSVNSSWWATLLHLVSCSDLSLVSVWSPTFWLRVMEDIEQNWVDLREALNSAQWGRHQAELQALLIHPPQRSLSAVSPEQSDFWKRLWPHLSLISAWSSSTSASWALEIGRRLPHVAFQAKGLWATEGVVTFPYRNKNVLATQSHFFEFRDLASNEIVPSWQLQANAMYQPILWTSTGLLRYALNDRVRAVDRLGDTPCLEFQGRIHGVDLVGEKIDQEWLQALFASHPEWQAFSALAVREPRPHYVLLHQASAEPDWEKFLLGHHHYRVARELGQLGPAQTIYSKDPLAFIRRSLSQTPLGQMKIELLYQIPALVLEP